MFFYACLGVTLVATAITAVGLGLAYQTITSGALETFVYFGAPVSGVVAAAAGLTTLVAGVIAVKRRRRWSALVLGVVALAAGTLALAAGAWLRFAWGFGHPGG